jgi:L-ascorbate metabolism protein UlaG (beta-lactamase superfamily)
MKISRKQFIKTGALGGLLLFTPFNGTKGKDDDSQLATAALKPDISKWSASSITISWIGHSTVLINFFGKWILTDPVFFRRIGLYMFSFNFGPSRYTHPALTIDEIPKPDLLLLSHAHMDHMDYLSLKEISSKFPNEIDVITAFNNKDVIEDLEWKSLTEMDWNDQLEINGLTLQALEVKHFGWRFPWEKDRSKGDKDGRSFNSYLITRNNKNILFGGDTAFMNKWEILKDKEIEMAIVPIGAYNPWRRNHCNPEEALMMADKIKAKHFIPIHCNTFDQGQEPREEPIKWLKASIANYNVKLGLDKIGETFALTNEA